MAYFTNVELNTYLGTTIDDANYQRAHDYVKQRIEDYCGQEFEQNTYTESRMLDSMIYFNHQPVKSVSNVIDATGNYMDINLFDTYEWGIAVMTGIESSGANGWYGSYTMPSFTRRVSITYVAGWDTMPQAIKELALWMTRKLLVPQDVPDDQGLTSISTNGVTMNVQNADFYGNRLTGHDYWDAVANQYRLRRVG